MKQQHNPTQHGACNWDQRVRAGWKQFRPQDNLGEMLDSRVVSTPNGLSYGPIGFTPCNHVLHVQYERGHYQFDGIHSKTRVA